MTKRVLDVGQCNPDHSSISRFLTANFDIKVVRAHLFSDALQQLRANSFDLVLVNRLLDADHSEGAEIIKAMQSDASLKSVPVMLVSNFEEAQASAIALGAVRGFGKAAILTSSDEKITKRLSTYLGD